MAGDVLSQSEVESLLSANDPQPQNTQEVQRAGDSHVTLYEFKRPERVSNSQMSAIRALHDGFSRDLGASLSAMLRTICEIKLISVDQLTYGEFVFSLTTPTYFTRIKSAGLDGYLLMDLNPSIVFPIVDRLLGGGKHGRPSDAAPQRPLTDIELQIADKVTAHAIKALERAWENICELKLEKPQSVNNPQLVQIVADTEVVVLVLFEISMGEQRGVLSLCIPFNTIESQTNKLTSDSWLIQKRRGQDFDQKLKVETGLSRATVELVVRMASTNLTTGEVYNLEIGDVIMTDHKANQGAEILIEGRPVFQAAPGVLQGKKAIRVGTALKSPKALVEEQLAKAAKQSKTA